jgi:hypothetical protein
VGKISARLANIFVATVQIDDELTGFELGIKQETPDVSALSDIGPRRVVGNYDYSFGGDGHSDFATGQGDATLFSLVGASAAKPLAFEPTGAAVGASDPHYDSTDMLLTDYKITGKVGGSVDYSFALAGNAALTRAVA